MNHSQIYLETFIFSALDLSLFQIYIFLFVHRYILYYCICRPYTHTHINSFSTNTFILDSYTGLLSNLYSYT